MLDLLVSLIHYIENRMRVQVGGKYILLVNPQNLGPVSGLHNQLEGSVVAAVIGGRCLQRLRPTGRTDAQPPIGDNPAKELQAALLQVLQVPSFWSDFLAVHAGCAMAATTERSPPSFERGLSTHPSVDSMGSFRAS